MLPPPCSIRVGLPRWACIHLLLLEPHVLQLLSSRMPGGAKGVFAIVRDHLNWKATCSYDSPLSSQVGLVST